MNHTALPFLLVLVAFIGVMRVTRRGRRSWYRQPAENAISPADFDALERRLASAEQLERRVDELENRLDFAERLLARGSTSEERAVQGS